MTPKEKAIQLVKNFEEYCEGVMEYQKDCALIAVDEIIKEGIRWQYWYEVKQEIEKL